MKHPNRQLQENFKVHASDEAESESDKNIAENNITMRKSLQNVMKIFAIIVGMSSLIANPMNNGKSVAEVKIENAVGGPMLYVWPMKKALTGDAFHANFELTGPYQQ